MGIILQVLT